MRKRYEQWEVCSREEGAGDSWHTAIVLRVSGYSEVPCFRPVEGEMSLLSGGTSAVISRFWLVCWIREEVVIAKTGLSTL